MGLLCLSPTALTIRSLFSDLLGKAVEVRAVPGDPLPMSEVAAVAVFVTEASSLAAVAACDLQLGGALGAALALLPARLVDQARDEGVLREDVRENLDEVFNVMSTVFNADGRPRISLHRVHGPAKAAPLPASVASVLNARVGREPFEVKVPGYRGGRLEIVAR
jgi:hypothetical protein